MNPALYILALLTIPTASFGAPFELGYSGRLTESSGRPVGGPVDLTVQFYHHATNPPPVAADIPLFGAVPLTDGVFHLTLALSPVDFHLVFDGNNDVWIEVTDVTHAKTYPRQRFSAVPFALKVPVDDATLSYDDSGLLKIKTNNAPAADKVLKVTAGGQLTWGNDSVTGANAVANGDLQTNAVTSNKIADGTIVGADIAPGTITNDKLTPITDVGMVADSALSAQVTKLGSDIDLATEVTGTLADGSLSANVTKLGGDINLATEVSGILDDTSLSANVTKLGGDIDLATEVTGTLNDGSLSANVTKLGPSIDLATEVTGTLADGSLSANVTKLGPSIDLATEVNGTLADGSLSANVTKLGPTIELDTEVAGILGDGSLSANVTKLGSDINLANAETVGTLPVTKGGTGVATLSGIVKGNGVGAFSVAVASDIPAQSHLAASDGTPAQALIVDASGNVGVGSATPRATLDVYGPIVGRASVVNGTATIDFATSNIQHTASNCGAFALWNLKDGGSYLFIVKGTTSTTCSFTAFSGSGTSALTVHLPPNHAATTGTKHTLYNIAVSGGDAYLSWIPGY